MTKKNIDQSESLNNYFEKFIAPLFDKHNHDKIYHYTNIDGFEGIFTGGKKDGHGVFWASHTDFLNDKTELIYTLNLSVEIFKTVCTEKGLSEEQVNVYTDIFEKELIKVFHGINKFDYYTLSFSINRDSNLLWSNYSNNDGYNIEFDVNALTKQFECYCYYVIYEREHQESLLKRLLSDILGLLLHTGTPGKIRAEDKEDVISALETLAWFSIFFKDRCFSQEEEFRIAFRLPKNDKGYQCRKSNGSFIPYIEREFNKQIVTGVTIGPKNNMDITQEGLHKFLKLNEIEIPLDKIKKSGIPYRY
ncbi:DUF2971 domain-containing protein [Bacillus altitudinis]|uniref:DUF2971 domain-containing protein n=1 Tax=Bacillus altitudinis TaxID=293387 RepID=UPI0024871CD7|nr:hypothetical protein [Micromonospora sp. 1209]